MGKSLKSRPGRGRVIPDMKALTPFQELIRSALGEEAVEQAAKRCDVPRWVFDDLFRRGSIPRSTYFDRICAGLGIDKRKAALAAHGIEDSPTKQQRTAAS